MKPIPWTVLETTVSLDTPWVRLVGERLQDDAGRHLAYWRVERVDSIVIIPVCRDRLVLPRSYYRHGVHEVLLDFPGGRYDGSRPAPEAAADILVRELEIAPEAITRLTPVNDAGWVVDSSFSSQRLFVFEAVLEPGAIRDQDSIALPAAGDAGGLAEVLSRLVCLQCRCALLEWARKRSMA